MVRHFPKGESSQHDPSLSHAIFTFAFITATIAIVSFLCGKKKRKRSLLSKKPRPKAEENAEVVISTPPTNNSTNEVVSTTPTNNSTNEAPHVDIEDKRDSPPPPESTIKEEIKELPPPPESTVQEEIKELPPPPRLASIRASSYHVPSSSKTFHNAKLTSSMSMRLSGRFKGLKKGSKRHDSDETLDNDKLTREDSVWKKTIILGERCRIPDEDDDDIILDENGQPITTFHRKQSCSSSISRQSSDVNQRCDP